MSLTHHQQQVLAYAVNRSTRWSLEDTQAPTITEAAAAHISAMLPEETPTTTARLDKLYFTKHDPDAQGNSWVRGCPDLLLQCGARSYHVELKIKTEAFRKTIAGGQTKSGAPIAAYGCASHYLDHKVLAQQNAFCARTSLAPEQFLVMFTRPNATPDEMHIITLAWPPSTA